MLVAPWSLALNPLLGLAGLAFPDLRRDSPARCLGDPALSPQHPPPAALRDDQPRRAGGVSNGCSSAGAFAGNSAHAPADADLPAGVPPLCRADGDLPGRPAAGGAAGVRAVFRLDAGARWPGTARSTRRGRCRRSADAAPAWHRAARGRCHAAAGRRVGHTLVLGTTRVGKTRLAELFITQDIRRKVRGEHEGGDRLRSPRAMRTC